MGLVSIPIRLLRAARAERVPLRQLYRPSPRGPSPEGLSGVRPEVAASDSERRLVSEPIAAAATAPEVVPVKHVFQPANQEQFVQPAEVVKGYESSKGQYVILDEQELRQIAPKTSTEMEIAEFVRFGEVDPIYLETSYYVVPDGTGEKAYALLFDAMREDGYAALAQVSMHRRDHVMIVRAGQTGLVAHTMFYADEVRTIDEFRTDTKLASQKERELAKALIHAMLKPFEPDRFKNRFREQLQQLIAARAAEHQTARVDARTPAPVIDILDALQRSLTSAQQAAAQQREAPRRPPRSERTGTKSRKRVTNG